MKKELLILLVGIFALVTTCKKEETQIEFKKIKEKQWLVASTEPFYCKTRCNKDSRCCNEIDSLSVITIDDTITFPYYFIAKEEDLPLIYKVKTKDDYFSSGKEYVKVGIFMKEKVIQNNQEIKNRKCYYITDDMVFDTLVMPEANYGKENIAGTYYFNYYLYVDNFIDKLMIIREQPQFLRQLPPTYDPITGATISGGFFYSQGKSDTIYLNYQ